MSSMVITCDVCGQPDADPYYTKKITEIRKGDKQPVWRCKKHKPAKVVKAV